MARRGNKINYRELEDEYQQIVDDKKDKKKVTVNDILSRKKIKVVGKNDSQKELIRSIKENEITICTGRAGSGKTFVSLAYALNLLQNNEKYQRLYLMKSVTTLKGEEIGFLKGDLNEKIEPFMWSFLINMEKIIDDSSIKNLMESDIIKPFPLAYTRGASLDNCIIIVDEIQNVSLDNARTILTRIGENSKMILLGDSNQIDLKNKYESSLHQLLEMFKDVNEIGTIKMNDSDSNIRNPIIDLIEVKYEEYINNKEKINNLKSERGRPKAA